MRTYVNRLRRHGAKAALVLIFSVPLLASFAPTRPGSAENRVLAPAPATPHDWQSTLAWPAQADRWINDHLGLRNELVALNNALRYRLFHQFPTSQLLQGQHGRLFLSAYNSVDLPYSGIQSVCGYGADPALPDALARDINTFGATMRAQGLGGRLLLVPSAPVVYQEDLPQWLQARCRASAVPLQLALASPQLRHPEDVLYPLQALRAARGRDAIFPSTWFHWAGDGPRLAAEASAARFWNAPAAAPLPSQSVTLPSDLDNLAPGLGLNSAVKLVDMAAAGVQECHGGSCFAEAPQLMAKLWGVNRYRNPAAPLPRLVLITDSFGVSAGPWFARYFQDVLQVATNDLARLTPAEVTRLKTVLFPSQTPQQLLFLYHDGTVQGGGRVATDMKLLFPAD